MVRAAVWRLAMPSRIGKIWQILPQTTTLSCPNRARRNHGKEISSLKKSAPSKSGVTLSVATIWDRKYYRSGEKLPFTIQSLPEHLRPYVLGDEPEAPDEDAAPQASYVLGEVYGVDGDDRLVRRRRRAVERQMVEMSAQAAEEDAIHRRIRCTAR